MHIYFIRNRGEIMKQNKKIAITHYISIRFFRYYFYHGGYYDSFYFILLK